MYLMADTIHGVQSGNVRGLGKQQLASVVTIGCYYIFGLPLALWLGFTLQLELMGFWLGFFVAMIILDVIIAIVVIYADWEVGKKAKQEAAEDDEYVQLGNGPEKEVRNEMCREKQGMI